MKKTLAFLLCLAGILSSTALFAQTKAKLTVECDEVGASVFINGRLSGYTNPSFSQVLPPGTYAVKVEKKGFKTFETQVRLAGKNVSITVKLSEGPGKPGGGTSLRPLEAPKTLGTVEKSVSYTIRANVTGATVSLNGSEVGKTPLVLELKPGSYEISIKAPGYRSESARVTVKEAGMYTADLAAETYTLTVRSNVTGAEVLVNGTSAGKTPFKAELVGGNYKLTVRAPGFSTWETQAVISASLSLDANLLPAKGSLSVSVPNQYLDRSNRRDRVQLFVNDAPQAGLSAELDPGTYRIKLVSGAFSFENTVVVEAGKTISLELNAGLLIR